MKRAKLIVILIAVIFCIAFAFSACSGRTADTGETDIGGYEPPVTDTPGLDDTPSDDDEQTPPTDGDETDDGGYMPPPEEGQEVPEGTPSADMAVPTPDERQTILLWDADNIPAYNERYQQASADPDDFIPYIESYPAQGDIEGAVLICPEERSPTAVCRAKAIRSPSSFHSAGISASW